MKPIFTLLKWSSFLLLASSSINAQDTIEERKERAKQVELFYSIAAQAYEDGDLEAARESLRSALALNRTHAHSIALSRRMRTNGSQTVIARRKRVLENVVIPLIDLNEASVKDAVKVLGLNVENETNGKVIPNFVIQDKNKKFAGIKITLKLRNVPAGEILNHIIKSSNGSVNYGKYTTVIRPRTKTVKVTPATE